jgi:hypothetical protein
VDENGDQPGDQQQQQRCNGVSFILGILLLFWINIIPYIILQQLLLISVPRWKFARIRRPATAAGPAAAAVGRVEAQLPTAGRPTGGEERTLRATGRRGVEVAAVDCVRVGTSWG